MRVPRVRLFIFSAEFNTMKHFLHYLLLLCCLSLFGSGLQAQDSLRWSANLGAEGFFRNNEYAQSYGTGYTLPGYRLQGTVAYSMPEVLSGAAIEVGTHATGFFGARRYPTGTWWAELPHWTDESTVSAVPHLVPLFGVLLRANPHLEVRVGRVDNSEAHQLIQPLYNPELHYSADPEMGVQLKANYPWLKSDFWIDWQSFTFRADRHQEAFTMGLSLDLPIVEKSTYSLSAIGQVVATHRGGEISWHRHDTVHSYLASAIGLRASWALSHGRMEAATYYLPSLLRAEAPAPMGHAFYVTLGYQRKHLLTELAYWQGSHFVSPMGGPFVNSRVLWEGPLVRDQERTSFLGIRAHYQFFSTPLVQMAFVARGWYHLLDLEGSPKRFSHSLELNLALTPRFRF